MAILVQQDTGRGLWVASWDDLDNCPVGSGTNPRAAVGDLFIRLLARETQNRALSTGLLQLTTTDQMTVLVQQRGKWRKLDSA